MIFSRASAFSASAAAQIEALNKALAIVEFDLDGNIITANGRFLEAFGYLLSEVQGQHHRMFVDANEQDTQAYRDFWAALNRGEHQSREFRRIGKGGRTVWIQATYNPIPGRNGKPVRVIKFATDITLQKARSLEDAGQLAAFSRAQAIIEFNLDGSIITANELFLNSVGYKLDEIRGKHHSIFLPPAERNTPAYKNFWLSLKSGRYQHGEFKRIAKDGREIWILASYNPIMDENGAVVKIVKLASDVTQSKLKAAEFQGQIEAIGKSLAVIEFDLDGTILNANAKFLDAMGYSLPEIKGRHHSLFVEASERESPAYREFWAALKRGEYQAGEFKRVGSGGKEVWIQASYSPILDLNGRPFKVVKYASDITRQVLVRLGNERVRSMMESVAASSEELSASVREISQAMFKSKENANIAVERASVADTEAKRLSTAANSMRGIVEIIGNITGQINLLALNATIESARAGQAGRGFAVVAAEVKNLANQAKQAADKIEQEICGLNEISMDVIEALDAIKCTIQAVSEFVTATAAAVEEQSSVTNDMSSSMQRAAQEAAAIASS
ncbi:PAS domain-containing methyl-accepting chemotaxis protein [Bradyrhizobium sp.]|uniref:methyl-accepting chemotaxis protein n=1 Tax=Bradyrhizobium sp. TaxID=376 RepID=UPI0023A012FE|nr:PAS domain-containing methyl-accepting chemotaxis protein [Bradyrhizobium sp.]MDE1932514.1 PAS domain-containing methyl-accepting chemotaxis protein [Bradyrhizobium sp.]